MSQMQTYPSDLTDTPEASTQPLLPKPYKRGRRRRLDYRRVLDAIFYLERTDSPDGQRAVGAEVGVPSTLADQEQDASLPEGEGAGDGMLVAFRALIGGGDGPPRAKIMWPICGQ